MRGFRNAVVPNVAYSQVSEREAHDSHNLS